MSPKTEVEVLPAPPTPPHIECAGGCTPAHRKLRRVLLSVVGVLILVILATYIYIAHSGGLTP